eukprot:2283019-Pyramimonas_sp.AAC.1
MNAVGACERSHWCRRWRSRWGCEACEGCVKMVRWAHANATTGMVGGVPCAATQRAMGVPHVGAVPTCNRSRWG